MYHENELLKRELEFTNIYRQYKEKDKATREAACLQYQIPHIFRTFRNQEHDILVGRIDKTLIGFYAISEGTGCLDQMGYVVHEDKCREKIQNALVSGNFDSSKAKELEEMLDFWHYENTCAKGQKLFTPEMERSMTGIDYNHEIGIVYPLYRLAGLNLDIKKLCSLGLQGLIEHINNLKKTASSMSNCFYEGCISVLKTLQNVCTMYAEDIESLIPFTTDRERVQELRQIKEDLLVIRTQTPSTLRQAIQLTVLYMLASDSREIGRIDEFFGCYYCNDVKTGILTKKEAVRLVINFFDIIEQEFSRDTRAIIGGKGRTYEKEADEFAMVVLDALEQRPYSWQPQVSLRMYQGMDQRLYEKSLDILSQGRTFPIFYNDDVNIPSVMRAMDVSRRDAEQYSFFGCGEYMIAGKSVGTPNALLNLAKILEVTLHGGIDPITRKACGLSIPIQDEISFEELWQVYEKQTAYCCDLAGDFQQLSYDICQQECSWLLQSILTEDCLTKGKALLDGGVSHLGGTVETYGNITTSDSLTAIRKVVYDKKLISLTRLVEVLDHNFEGYEELRKQLIDAPKFGNDSDYADEMAVRVHESICSQIRRQKLRTRLDSLLVVVINNSMNVFMGQCTGASADGRKAKEFLSNGNGAYNNRDKEGITALIRSMTKLDTSIHAGTNQNFKFSPSLFKGDKSMIKAILHSFFALGGQQTNISVVNQEELEDAMLHPENHENLIVRVGGYTARFVTLNRCTQQDILSRTAY